MDKATHRPGTVGNGTILLGGALFLETHETAVRLCIVIASAAAAAVRGTGQLAQAPCPGDSFNLAVTTRATRSQARRMSDSTERDLKAAFTKHYITVF